MIYFDLRWIRHCQYLNRRYLYIDVTCTASEIVNCLLSFVVLLWLALQYVFIM